MIVTLLTSEGSLKDMESFAAIAALTCHGNAEKKHVPSEVLRRIIKAGHESILEHINLTYSIKGLSRACLQELARHRHISLSVESTRHTLRKYLERPEELSQRMSWSIYQAGMSSTIAMLIDMVKAIPILSNDDLKYFLPEFWPTNLILTGNVRELRHILKLRTAPAALKEFRELARAMYEAVPEQFKYLLTDCVHKEVSDE